MHRSSESIAALAAALAKAQSELTNPEKSLVATIGTDRPAADRVTEPEPAVAVAVPLQVLLSPLGVDTTSPEGRMAPFCRLSTS